MSAPRRVVIELDAGPDPIAGLLLMDGSGRRFEGYTQLIAALEDARAAADPPRDDADQEESAG